MSSGLNGGLTAKLAKTDTRWLVLGAGSVLLAAAAALAVSISGCQFQECQQVQDGYEEAITRESGLVEVDEDGPPHLAMALRMDFVNDLSSRALEAAIGDSLEAGGSVDIGGGQSAGFSVGATGASLEMEASHRCGGCVDISGDFDGSATVDLPAVGEQSTPVSGSISWVVPLDVGRDGDELAVFFDTQEEMQMGMPDVDARLDGLSDSWAEPVASAVADELVDQIVDQFEPVRLVGYQMPEFGIEGLEFVPSLFALEHESNVLKLGLRTNTDVRQRRGSPEEVFEALAPGEGQNVALAIQPGFVTEVVRLALYGGEVPRRYSLSGQARSDGPARVVADGFDVGAHRSDDGALELGLDFRVFCFNGGIGCFSVTGSSRSRFAIENGQLAFDVEEVEFADADYFSDLANWASAEFVEHTQGVVRRSLDDEVVSSDDSSADVRGERISTEAGLLIVRGVGSSE